MLRNLLPCPAEAPAVTLETFHGVVARHRGQEAVISAGGAG